MRTLLGKIIRRAAAIVTLPLLASVVPLGNTEKAFAADQICLTVAAVKVPGRMIVARGWEEPQARPNKPLNPELNSQDFPVERVSRTLHDRGYIIAWEETGCQPLSRVVMGTNTVSYAACIYDNINGTCYQQTPGAFRIELWSGGSRSAKEKLLCVMEVDGGPPWTGYLDCLVKLEFDPDKLLPGSKRKIEGARERALASVTWLRGIEAQYADLMGKKATIEAELAKDPETISPERLIELSRRLQSTADLLRNLQKTLGELRAQTAALKLEVERASNEAVAVIVTTAQETLGVQISDTEAQRYIDSSMPAAVPFPEGDGAAGVSDIIPASDENAFKGVATLSLNAMKACLAAHDRRCFLEARANWVKRLEEIMDALETMGARPDEMEAFLAAAKPANQEAAQHADEFGFFYDVVSTPLVELVRGLETATNGRAGPLALELRDVLNTFVTSRGEGFPTQSLAAAEKYFETMLWLWTPRASPSAEALERGRAKLLAVAAEAVAVLRSGRGALECQNPNKSGFHSFFAAAGYHDPCLL